MANFFKATAKKQQHGQEINVKITRLDINGCGVGQYNKKPIFIDGTLPNEVVQVKVFEQNMIKTNIDFIEQNDRTVAWQNLFLEKYETNEAYRIGI